MLTERQITDYLRTAAAAPSERAAILRELICDGLSETRAAIIMAALDAESAQTHDDYDAWSLAAECIADLATEEQTACECAMFDAAAWGGYSSDKADAGLMRASRDLAEEVLRLRDEMDRLAEDKIALEVSRDMLGRYWAEAWAEVASLQAEVARLREALAFYAAAENYDTHYETMPCECCTDIFEPVMRDRGERARAALARITEKDAEP